MTKLSKKVNHIFRIFLILLGIKENEDGNFSYKKLITSGWVISIGVIFGTIFFQSFSVVLWIIICLSLLLLSNFCYLKEVNQN
jgi:hypothetical protein